MSGIVSDLALPISRRVIASPSVVWLPDAVRHVLASAIVYLDGTSLRVSFGGLMAATTPAAGWSVTDGGLPVAISSAVINGRILDITLAAPITINGEVLLSFNAGLSDLTVIGSGVPFASFSNRPVQNLSWSPGALWTPASHGTNLDYGNDSDLTRLFKTNAFTTPVTAPGDPVVRWRGQRDVLYFGQGTAANQPSYQPNGVVFDTSGGVSKTMFATSARNHDAPTYCLIFQTVSDRVLGGGGSLHSFATGGIRTGPVALAAEEHFYAVGKNRYTETTQDTLGESVVGSSWDGTSLTFFDDDADATVVVADASTVNPTGFVLGVIGAVTGVKSRTHAWAVGNGVITPDDYKKHAWWARYAS